MNQKDSTTTPLAEYIAATLPWAHGHQLKSITTFVAQIMDQQTGIQAQLARGLGNQEAALKRLSRLLHNSRLSPKVLAEAVLWQALDQLPARGPVRVAVDWTSEATQHLLVVSLIVGRRAVPIYWRAYDASVLKGRMRRYELAVIRHALTALLRQVGDSGRHRLMLTADRGFADVQLVALLEELRIAFVLRVKGSTKVCYRDQWCKFNRIGFAGNTRHVALGWLLYCESSPQRLWVTMSRQRGQTGKWGIWYLIGNRPLRAQAASAEYGHRFGCEEGFRDAKWWLGFAQARVRSIQAWSRLFALFVLALLATVSLGVQLLLRPGVKAWSLLRRVTSRRRSHSELSLVSVMLSLLQHDKSLLQHLSPAIRLDLNAALPKVS